MLTFFNDKRDWRLRLGFFKTIAGVALYCGSKSLEKFILPLIEKCFLDRCSGYFPPDFSCFTPCLFDCSEEFVIEQTVRAVTLCCELGLFTKPVQRTLTPSLVRLLAHPSLRVRFAAAAYVAALARRLGMTDLHASLRPLLAPHLKQPLAMLGSSTDMDVLLDALNPPVCREAYDYVVNSPAHEAYVPVSALQDCCNII
jgi:phosphoinositide-3-kinase regulatory subunit 4